MFLPFAKGSCYYVVGLGKSGWSAVDSLTTSGATVFVWDDQEETRHQAAHKGLQVVAPADLSWDKITSLVLSPGIPHQYPAPHPAAERACHHKVPLVCDIDLFFQAKPRGPVVGITGTNGKSTTVALVAHCLREAGVAARAAGNIGVPILAAAKTAQDPFITVLELSSYHLERVPHLALDVAVHLNLAPDHLARHGGMAGYSAAKRHIFDQATTAIVGVDDERSHALYEGLSVRHKRGVTIQGSRVLAPERRPMSLQGTHNLQNIFIAEAVCEHFGVGSQTFAKALQSFPGLPHRQEIVREEGGLTFVNDSKATNVASTAQALKTFETIFWIAGGQSKGPPSQKETVKDLKAFFPKIKKAYLIGEAMASFAEDLQNTLAFEKCGTLEKAVHAAYQDAQKEKRAVVLLSPACASFDQFQNFEARGEAFRSLVQSLQFPQSSQSLQPLEEPGLRQDSGRNVP